MMSDLRRRGTVGVLLGLVTIVTVTGCGLIPADPDGTLDRVHESGVLRVGASPSPGLVSISADGVNGPWSALIDRYAQLQSVRTTWAVGSEEDLVRLLEGGALDVAIGGMSVETPWSERVSVTRGYEVLRGDTDLVVFVPQGENALLSSIEKFLDDELGG